jgi:RHS repeat-associated protein
LITGYEYDEFGNLERSGVASFLNETTFTGSVTDTSTGLQYMNARHYNPETGRFLSQDTYSGNAYEPWTQHLYSYCGNNPTNMVDPTGHVTDWSSGGGVRPTKMIMRVM